MRWLAALLLAVGLAAPLAAQEAPVPAPVLVRQSADPATGAVVGQHVTLTVDVLFPGTMPHPPRVEVPDVPGLQIFRFETQGATRRETIGGQAYVGQRFEFALYARRGGTFEIPPASVTLLDRQGDETGRMQGQPVRLEVTVPPGIDASQPVVATSRLTLDEQWTPAPTGSFRAGDAVVRTITRTAEDVPGLALRDLAVTAPDGVRVYADPPDIADRSNRGVVTGYRTDRVTYVFERGGRFDLPALVQPWWDLATQSARTAEAAAATISVAGAGPVAAGRASHWSSRLIVSVVAGIAGLLALAWTAWHLSRRWRAHDPLREAYVALRRACAGTDASEIYRSFQAWATLLPPAQRQAAQRAATGLQAALFAPGARAWSREDSTRLLAELQALRHPAPAAGAVTALPPLNPA